MVEALEGVGVEVDKVARQVDRDKLAKTVPVVEIARHDTLDEERALVEPLAGARDDLAGLDGRRGADGGFEARALAGLEAYPATVSQEAIG